MVCLYVFKFNRVHVIYNTKINYGDYFIFFKYVVSGSGYSQHPELDAVSSSGYSQHPELNAV